MKLIIGGTIGYSNYKEHKIEWVSPKSKIKSNKPYSVYSNKFDLRKMIERLIGLAI